MSEQHPTPLRPRPTATEWLLVAINTAFVAAGIDNGLTHPIHRLDTASFTVIADDGTYNEAYVPPPTRPPRA